MSLHQTIDLDRDLPRIPTKNINFHPTTGISCLIVGAGVGGLTTALECRRKGHSVRVVERSPTPNSAGDFFSIGRNIVAHLYNYWPDLAAECECINYSGVIAYHKITGERISGPEPVPIGKPTMTLNDGSEKIIPFSRHHRPKFVAALLAQVKGLGIEVTFGAKVTDYLEDADKQKAGIVLESGERIEADVVIAADGIGTKSHKLVNGGDDRAYSSGISIFRTSFPVELALSDPEVRDRWPLLDGNVPCLEIWGGDNMSFFVQRYSDIMCWLMTHKSDGKGMESWNQTVDVSEVLKITAKIPGFPEVAERLIKTTPNNGIIDWEIMWRDPRENWISPCGRVVQVGDSAHTFLPSSGSGATQAMEDAISLATCLEIGGKRNVTIATKIHNKLRFERVSCVQLSGFMNHQKQSNPVYSAENDDKESFKINLGDWIVMYDSEKYTYAHYGEVLHHLHSGMPLKAKNIPRGYTYKPWTIKGLLDMVERGEKIHFDGDWS
ncbi:hypothetical protein EYB25_009245 [Talaromyces marneffei]|uniref:Monoxygenase, putative n=1 Tax=Talaromyces marneffei (strain ATCC 18224 / CBS 334.59 / QM 7333) TaxID=441960 RepID=B6QW49_TALMQ|nr:monoxygenase, putative [Talaromyces marneffei ATCC 18224]KAE8548862.1 hypothetical protein EYB25_009245 [Talaromyces marneffei]